MQCPPSAYPISSVIIAMAITQSRSIRFIAAFNQTRNQTRKSLPYYHRRSASSGKLSLPTQVSSRTPSSAPKILYPCTSKLSVEFDPKSSSLQWQELELTCSPHFFVHFPLLLIEHAVCWTLWARIHKLYRWEMVATRGRMMNRIIAGSQVEELWKAQNFDDWIK